GGRCSHRPAHAAQAGQTREARTETLSERSITPKGCVKAGTEMRTLLGLSLLSLGVLLPESAQALAKEEPATAARLALVTSDRSNAIRNVLTLAEAKLGELPHVKLLERQAIDKVLAEQKLSLSGLVAPDQAVALGKLLSVDVFAVLEAGANTKE